MKRQSKRAMRPKRVRKVEASATIDTPIVITVPRGARVAVHMPAGDTEATVALRIMKAIYPQLTDAAIAQFFLDDALNQACTDLSMLETYAWSAAEHMEKGARE